METSGYLPVYPVLSMIIFIPKTFYWGYYQDFVQVSGLGRARAVKSHTSHPFLPLSQVRLQTQPKPKPGESLLYAGTIDCFKKTLAKEVSMHTDVNSGIY